MLNITCPKCGKTSTVELEVIGQRVKCGRCQHKFIALALDSIEHPSINNVSNAAQDPQAKAPDLPNANPNPSVLPQQPQDEPFLDQVIGILYRMIVGVIRFAFFRLPILLLQAGRWLRSLVSQLLRWLSPTLRKLCIIFFLSCLWSLLVAGPIVFHQFWTEETWRLSLPEFLQRYKTNPTALVTRLLVYSWTVIAIAGSFWGILYVRRRIKLLKQQKIDSK